MGIKYYIDNKALYTSTILKKIKYRLWKMVNYTSACWWGVNLGKGCRFMGKTHFVRLQDGEITIGNNCRFNSSPTSNLSGLFVPCIISNAKKGDVIVLAGKGHETYQEINGEKYPFDEREIIKEIIK